MIFQVVFWVSISVILYIYVGYPLLLLALAIFKPKFRIPEAAELPTISVLMAVHNEADRIEQAIANNLENGYPPDKIEVIVCSDGSTDNTDELVDRYDDTRVKLVSSPEQIGVNEVVALGAEQASGELFLLTHAKTSFQQGAIETLARHFTDPRVGIATGRIIYRNPMGTAVGSGYRGYWLVEAGVRSLESRLGLGVVVVGAFEMIRKQAYLPVPSQYSNDMTAPMYTRSKGLLCRYEPKAIQFTDQTKSSSQEFARRVRIAVRAWCNLPYMLTVVPLWKNLTDWAAILSHKYLRWFTWPFMIAAAIANVAIIGQGRLYFVSMALQIAFYAAAVIGWLLAKLGLRQKLFWPAFYFCLLQTAAAVGFFQALLGKRIRAWTPTK